MKILNARQVKKLDEYTIRNDSIASIDLMEAAAEAFVDEFKQLIPENQIVKIFCGTGNNGGDGMAIARLLHEAGYDLKVYIIRRSSNPTSDFKTNEDRLRKLQTVPIYDIKEGSKLAELESSEIVIDAIIGIGLSKPVNAASLTGEVIKHINSAKCTTIAVDIPSGVFADKLTTSTSIEADLTISLELPKLAFMLEDSYRYIGDWVVLPIGLNTQFIEDEETDFELTDDAFANLLLLSRPRTKFDSKSDHGHALIAAGSKGKLGAAVFAVRGAVAAGAGLVTAHVPGVGYQLIQISEPSAMVQIDENESSISEIVNFDSYDVVGIGPGIGTGTDAKEAIEKVLESSELDTKLVLDADALNIIARNDDFLEMLPPYAVLTPHQNEFERLAGRSDDGFSRLNLLKKFSKTHNVIVVLKGAHTAIATPEGKVYFNSSGTPGLATGGTGDVLTGVITSLIAQGYSNLEACLLGVYVHGLAGELAADLKGVRAMNAGDVIDHIGEAFAMLES